MRTTTDGGPIRITEYLVNGTVVFIQEGDGLQPTSAGHQLLRAALFAETVAMKPPHAQAGSVMTNPGRKIRLGSASH